MNDEKKRMKPRNKHHTNAVASQNNSFMQFQKKEGNSGRLKQSNHYSVPSAKPPRVQNKHFEKNNNIVKHIVTESF